MGWLTDFLKEIPTAGVARERMALAQERAAAMEAEVERLKEENARVIKELDAARRQLPSAEFVEYRGVLFKRRAGGSFEPDAYCPDCKRVLSSIEAFLPLECSKCNFMGPFSDATLPAIVAQVEIRCSRQ
jgi:hypothetical protein